MGNGARWNTRGHLIAHLVQDMSLFWNLRTASNVTHPAWIIPIPLADATELGILIN